MIPLTLLNIRIQSEYPLDFGANPGSSIRGALYEALKAMYDTGDPVLSRHDDERNPVAWLLNLEDAHRSGSHDVPRPLAVRPPLEKNNRQSSFGLSFYGRGQAYITLVLSAVAAMQEVGIGRGRGRFKLLGIECVDPLTQQAYPLLDSEGKQVGQLMPNPDMGAYIRFAELLRGDHLIVHFMTPTRIVANGVLCHRPEFRPWFQRLLERIRSISELYTDSPVWVAFKELLAVADMLEIEQEQTRWVEMVSGSRRDGQMKPTSGFVGQVVYTGHVEKLLPWILLGQSLQVGKNTIKGCGWYQLRYEWRR